MAEYALRLPRRFGGVAVFGALLTLLVSWAPSSLAAAALELQPVMEGVPTVAYITLLEDPGGLLNIDDVISTPWQSRFISTEQNKTSQGVSGSAWWVRLRVANNSKAPVEWIVAFLYTQTDYLDAYQISQGRITKQYNAGDHRPFAARPIPAEGFAFPFVTAPGQRDEVYFRLAFSSKGMIDCYQEIWTPREYSDHQHATGIFLGLIAGVAGAMLIYNLFILFSVKTKEYFWYVLYMLAVIMMFLTYSGMGSRYFWVDAVALADALPIVSPAAVFVFATQFTRYFIDTRHWAPRLDRALKMLLGIGLLAILMLALGRREVAITLVLVAGLSLALFPVMGGLLWKMGNRIAFSYTVAWSFMWVVVAGLVMKFMGVLPNFSLWVIRSGFVAEAMLLALALAHRINILKQEKAAAETERQQAEERNRAQLENLVKTRTRELEESRRIAEALARTDPLTGLPNRRAFFERAEQELARSRRTGTPPAIIMFDIDRFKQINDTYGHAAGDEVIRHLARVVSAALRETDMVARIGGEEFALLLPETDGNQAVHLAERLRADIEQQTIQLSGVDVSVTSSFGVVAERPELELVDELLAKADRAMYKAKSSGRNRVAVVSTVSSTTE